MMVPKRDAHTQRGIRIYRKGRETGAAAAAEKEHFVWKKERRIRERARAMEGHVV